MNPQWFRQPGSRLPIRWCIFSSLLIICLLSLFSFRESYLDPEPVAVAVPVPEPEIAKSPFDECEHLINEAGVPPLTELSKQKDAGTHGSSSNQGARVISAKQLMELVDSGEHPGPRILHQSWKDGQLPEYFERWSMAWQRQLDETWVYVVSWLCMRPTSHLIG